MKPPGMKPPDIESVGIETPGIESPGIESGIEKEKNMMMRNKKIRIAALAASLLLISGCGAKDAVKNTAKNDGEIEVADAVSAASQVFYRDSSLNQEQLWAAIAERAGGCTVATVNEDGSPNLIVAVPATAGDSHIYFTWADNGSKDNVLRTGEAMVSYYIYHADAESKEERNMGARLKLELERDEKVLEQLAGDDATVKAGTVFKVKEILPLG